MRPLARTLLKGSFKQIRHVTAVPRAEAVGLVAEVYRQAHREFGVLAPPLALHSPAPEALAASWLLLRETLLADGHTTRAAREAVAVEVSRANECPYCVEVHQAKLDTLPDGRDTDTLTPFAEWARTSAEATAADPPLPLDPAGTAELYGVAVTFHYLNRMVRLFLPPSPVPAAAPAAGRAPVMRMVARGMRPDSRTPVAAGASLGLLPAAPLPAALAWAEAAPTVAGALARAVASADAAAEEHVPGAVRERLHLALSLHRGAAPGPGRHWLGPATEGLAAEHLPTARLALLVALAPYQITEADLTGFRAVHPGDHELVRLTSWAALTAAVAIGSRFP
ncbi:carboxymuconolactone decarboxylase family protein [Streptomyces sp. NPDC051567]|uniref:carboxymuconolactone decarboxylase family protein n=1 Tax=Streptomyces sp. NPDC051567 TaxID=3365660 RepID=UPI00379AB1F8